MHSMQQVSLVATTAIATDRGPKGTTCWAYTQRSLIKMLRFAGGTLSARQAVVVRCKHAMLIPALAFPWLTNPPTPGY